MTGIVRGWCPGAHRPMMSGDGLVVRIRPHQGRLTAAQALGLCNQSDRYGNGTIGLTNRANLQIRGVAERDHIALLDGLAKLDLLDTKPEIEQRRNILVPPLWSPGNITDRLYHMLVSRLSEFPDLPGKFGFALDTGDKPVLSGDPADIRIEYNAVGILQVRADGASEGTETDEDTMVDTTLDLVHWFMDMRYRDEQRMRDVVRRVHGSILRSEPPMSPLQPGPHDLGPVYGARFGQMVAGDLAQLLLHSEACAMRVTPWHLFLMEGGQPVAPDAFISGPDDPRLRVDACNGAPACPQSTVATRALAQRLAGQINGSLHVSGCAKGCARPRAATFTLVGRQGRFDLVRHGHAWDDPISHGLDPDTIQTISDLT